MCRKRLLKYIGATLNSLFNCAAQKKKNNSNKIKKIKQMVIIKIIYHLIYFNFVKKNNENVLQNNEKLS